MQEHGADAGLLRDLHGAQEGITKQPISKPASLETGIHGEPADDHYRDGIRHLPPHLAGRGCAGDGVPAGSDGCWGVDEPTARFQQKCYTVLNTGLPMPVRLNITIDEDVHERLKRDLPPKGISRFINDALRARLRPSREQLDTAYRAAAREKWRRSETRDWAGTDVEGWPE